MALLQNRSKRISNGSADNPLSISKHGSIHELLKGSATPAQELSFKISSTTACGFCKVIYLNTPASEGEQMTQDITRCPADSPNS